jgi:hypothetical protein
MRSAEFREIMEAVCATGSTLEAFMREAALGRARECVKTTKDAKPAS